MRRLCLCFLILALLLVLVGCPELFDKPTDEIPEGFVLVERGTFWMGDEHEDLSASSRPVHQVTLTYDFLIGKYPVTFSEYDAFCTEPSDAGWGRGPRPVINVSWWDAIAYCNWLSNKEGIPVAYRLLGETDEGQLLDASENVTTDITKVLGYRLPTEAEWEYAARGRTNQPPYKYAGSDNVDEVAWYWENSHNSIYESRTTWTVGLKESNALDIFDMSGNVWEWCSDWYALYDTSSRVNPYVSEGVNRVFRGGSFESAVSFVRVAARGGAHPNTLNNVTGFRIARTLQ